MSDCIVCPALHPDSDPGYADKGRICAPDYGLITSMLGDLPDYYRRFLNPPAIEADTRTWMRPVNDPKTGRQKIDADGWLVYEKVFADPVVAHLPVGPVRGASNAPRVSGGERSLGVQVGLLDLMVPVSNVNYLRWGPSRGAGPGDWWEPQVRTWTVVETVFVSPGDGLEGPAAPRAETVWCRELARDPNGDLLFVPAGDQIGQEPIPRWLDRMAQVWLLHGAPGRHLPSPTVDELTEWLLRRLDWAVDSFADIAIFALELKQARGALRAAVGDGEDQHESIINVRCGHCSTKSTLVRRDGRVECTHCDWTYNDEQFEELERSQKPSRIPGRRADDARAAA